MTKRPVKIAPSILSADFAQVGAECAAVETAGADVLVAGSAVFKGGSAEDPGVYAANIEAIRSAAADARQAA